MNEFIAHIQTQDDALVLEKTVEKPQQVLPPPFYDVFLLNDDYTPMELVVFILQKYFHKDREAATRIMLKVHQDGKACCGRYSRDIAATKVDMVLKHARKKGHPLQCVMEEA